MNFNPADLHPYWFIGVSAGVALVPLIIGVGTCYVKLSVALRLLRNGFGTQQMLSGLIVMVLSLAMTAEIMQPVISQTEERFYCFGEVDGGVLTVRFTYRASVIRIIGAGYWRKGKAIYEREN